MQLRVYLDGESATERTSKLTKRKVEKDRARTGTEETGRGKDRRTSNHRNAKHV